MDGFAFNFAIDGEPAGDAVPAAEQEADLNVAPAIEVPFPHAAAEPPEALQEVELDANTTLKLRVSCINAHATLPC